MKKYIAFLLSACLAVGIGSFWFLQVRPSENNRIADIRWHKGGGDMQATIRVVDLSGNPIPRVNVVITNNSGHNRSVTDDEGRAILDLGELDVEEIQIGGQTVLKRPDGFWIVTPNVRYGLIFEVKMKLPVQRAPPLLNDI